MSMYMISALRSNNIFVIVIVMKHVFGICVVNVKIGVGWRSGLSFELKLLTLVAF